MVIRGRLEPRHLMAIDALVGIALMNLAAFRTPDAGTLGWGLAALLGLPLAARRRWPVRTHVGVVLAGTAAIVVGVAGDAVLCAIAYTLYSVATSTSARRSALALAAAMSGVMVAGTAVLVVPGLPVVAPPPHEESFATSPLTVLPLSAVVVAGSWGLARLVRARRQQAAQLAELRAHQAVTEERLRIARDIHDVVGHSLSLIAMKAAVANHLAGTHPAEGTAALRTIERVSRSALDDVRAVLGTLRDPADSTPTLAGLDRLVEETRTAGLAVDLEPADLTVVPAAVQASAYRIVQEALANVLRHAGPTHCRVTLTVEPEILTVAIVDSGTARGVTGPPGHGLRGMRERAALHGGTLTTGREPGGGFAVRARLPFVPVGADDE